MGAEGLPDADVAAWSRTPFIGDRYRWTLGDIDPLNTVPSERVRRVLLPRSAKVHPPRYVRLCFAESS